MLRTSIEFERLSKIACANTCSRKSSQGKPTRLAVSHIDRRGECICGLGIAPESMVVTGTVAEWEGWLGTTLPGSGAYVIDGGLSGRSVEPASD